MRWFYRGRHRASRYSIRVTDLIPKPRCDFRDGSDQCVLRPNHGHFHEIHPNDGRAPHLIWKGQVRVGRPLMDGRAPHLHLERTDPRTFLTIAPPSGISTIPVAPLDLVELVAP